MERWAANTLRTLGIILIAGFMLITCGFLLLLSFCAYQGGFGGSKNPGQGFAFLIAAALVLAFGIWIIVWLARRMIRTSAVAALPSSTQTEGSDEAAQSGEPEVSVSPMERVKAIDRIIYAIGATIFLSTLTWFWSQHQFQTASSALRPLNWTFILLIPFVLYHVPYALLMYGLFKKPDQRTFAYSLVVPGILVMQGLFSVPFAIYMYILQHQLGFAFVAVPWFLHIVIFILAWKTIQQVGTHPEPKSLLVAALVTCVYFLVIHIATPLFFAFPWRFHG